MRGEKKKSGQSDHTGKFTTNIRFLYCQKGKRQNRGLREQGPFFQEGRSQLAGVEAWVVENKRSRVCIRKNSNGGETKPLQRG